MSRKQWRERTCKKCGAPSDHKALCARCSPHRLTTAHQDKYANHQPEEDDQWPHARSLVLVVTW